MKDEGILRKKMGRVNGKFYVGERELKMHDAFLILRERTKEERRNNTSSILKKLINRDSVLIPKDVEVKKIDPKQFAKDLDKSKKESNNGNE